MYYRNSKKKKKKSVSQKTHMDMEMENGYRWSKCFFEVSKAFFKILPNTFFSPKYT